uniref:DUF4806 domain-containing protein n=1 Tax=Anopheles epiroticus TaxID=199890 RepID=A0A182PHS9_9DIPT
MPFAIVEASDEDGSKDLYVVPEGWLLDTEQTETILLWPRCDGPKLYKLLTDGESVANTKWMKMDCVVKRINISHLSFAHAHVSKLKGECIETPPLDNSSRVQKSPTPTPVEEAASPTVPSADECTNEKESSLSKTVTWGKRAAAPPPVRKISEQDFYNFLKAVEQKLTPLEAFVRKIADKVLYLETQAEIVRHRIGPEVVPKAPSFIDVDFKQIDSLESIEKFNTKLLDESYRNKIYEWLNSQMLETKSENRMTEAIDLLFTKRFMPKCSWTGIGRGREKIAMMRMVNIMKLFRRIGTTGSTIVNQRMVMVFFMKKLRNAVRHSEIKHLRRSTSHNVPKQSVKLEGQ